jgi:hypothetical protein
MTACRAGAVLYGGITLRSSAQHGGTDAYADVIADLQVTVSTKVAHH